MNFTSFFSAIALAALVLINFGRQAPVKGKALHTGLDSMASVQAQLKHAPDQTTNSPVTSGRLVISGIGMEKYNVNYSQCQSADFSADFNVLAADVVGAVAVNCNSQRDIASPSSSCRITAHSGLGLVGSLSLSSRTYLELSAEVNQVTLLRQVIKTKQMQITNTKSAAAPAVNIIKKTVFSFKTRAIIAPKDLHKANWSGVVNEVGDGVNRLLATVELEATDPQGKRFTLTQEYSLLPNARGPKAFLADYNAWAGAGLTEDDLYESFDGAKDIGKPLVVKVDHRKVGKDWEAYIVSFHPPETTEAVAANSATEALAVS